MNIVITMAGLGSRFKKAGYDQPKYMINAHGKSLFEWSMLSLDEFNSDSKFIFIVREEDKSSDFITDTCEKILIKNFQIIEISELTDGQATTAMFGKKYWDPDKPLMIYNIDTYVESGYIKRDDIRGDGFIPCFIGLGDHWSFVKLDETERAIEVREKQRISKYCTLGAYYFGSCKLYETLYDEYYSDDSNVERQEKYVAPLYNWMIEKGLDIYISTVPLDKIHVLGTPDELNLFLKNYIVK